MLGKGANQQRWTDGCRTGWRLSMGEGDARLERSWEHISASRCPRRPYADAMLRILPAVQANDPVAVVQRDAVVGVDSVIINLPSHFDHVLLWSWSLTG